MPSQTNSVSIVYLTVCLGVDKKESKLRVTGLCEGNLAVTGEFPAQRESDVENASIWRHHHGKSSIIFSFDSLMVIPGVNYELLGMLYGLTQISVDDVWDILFDAHGKWSSSTNQHISHKWDYFHITRISISNTVK